MEPSPPYEIVAEQEVELTDYLRVVVHYRWLILWGALLCGLGAYWVRPLASRSSCRAHAVLLFTEEERPLGKGSLEGGVRRPASYYVELLQSLPLALKVAGQPYPCPQDTVLQGALHRCLNLPSESEAAFAVLKMLKVKKRPGGILELEVETSTPALALGLAGAYIQQLKQYEGQLRTRHLRAELALVKARLDTATRSLRQAEEAEKFFFIRNRNLLDESGAFRDPELNLEQSRLQRLTAAKASLYKMLLQRYETAYIGALPSPSSFEVLTPPVIEENPARSPYVALLIGGMAGGMIALFMGFFMHYWRAQTARGNTGFLAAALRQDWGRAKRVLGLGGAAKAGADPLERGEGNNESAKALERDAGSGKDNGALAEDEIELFIQAMEPGN